MRPGPIGPGIPATQPGDSHLHQRFNEAGANWPRNSARRLGTESGGQSASMRPGPIGPGI